MTYCYYCDKKLRWYNPVIYLEPTIKSNDDNRAFHPDCLVDHYEELLDIKNMRIKGLMNMIEKLEAKLNVCEGILIEESNESID